MVVGLVIREAAVRVVPLFTHPTGPINWDTIFPLSRFTVVVLMVIRFYLGAVTLIGSEWGDSVASVQNETISFLSGLAHFILFFAWASTIDIDVRLRVFHTLSSFEIALSLVLLYDLAWWLVSWGRRFDRLNTWTLVNTLTVVLCWLAHLALAPFTRQWELVECVTFVPVLVVSLIDISEIITQQEIFSPWFAKFALAPTFARLRGRKR